MPFLSMSPSASPQTHNLTVEVGPYSLLTAFDWGQMDRIKKGLENSRGGTINLCGCFWVFCFFFCTCECVTHPCVCACVEKCMPVSVHLFGGRLFCQIVSSVVEYEVTDHTVCKSLTQGFM